MERPRIVVTLANPDRASDPHLAALKNVRYVEALERAGAVAVPLDDRVPPSQRTASWADMDGLLLSGGADVDPARYGEEPAGARAVEPERDELEDQALRAALGAGVPVLGVCRGLQAINVFSGGSLVQHLGGHESEAYPSPAVTRHRLDLAPGSRLATILGASDELEVNSYHHQAIRPQDLAPGLVASGVAPHEEGPLVEALESADGGRWLVGVQCHPERPELIGPEFARLWRAFVDAARGAAHRS